MARYFLKNETKRQRLEIEILSTSADQFIKTLHDLCEHHNIKIVDLRVHIKEDVNRVILLCDTTKKANFFPVVEALRVYKGVIKIDIDLK